MRFVSALLGIMLVAGAANAADQRYDYDELGRLIRAVGDDGTVISYRYDPVGNILAVQVGSGDLVAPPDAIGFDTLRCGDRIQVELEGDGFEGTQVISSSPYLQVSNLRYTDNGVSFILAADCGEPLGEATLVLTNAAGSSTISLQVAPQLPSVFITPAPLAIPPDGSTRGFLLRLSHPDVVAHHFQVTSSDPQTVQVTTPDLTIEAGTTETLGALIGSAAGQAHLEIGSPTLGVTRIPVFVTAEFAGVNSSLASELGIMRLAAPSPPTTFPAPLMAPSLGVASGSLITGVQPKVLAIGTGPTPVEIAGRELGEADGLQVVPPEGVSVGPVAPSADGATVTVDLAVAEDAPVTLRRLELTRADGSGYPAAPANADRLRIALPAPVVHSISPLVVYPGDTAVPMTIRGERLDDMLALDVHPPTHISVADTFDINAAGTVATARLSIAPEAETGPRFVTVTTPGGTSQAASVPSNTLHVALEAEREVENLVGSTLGVTKLMPEQPPETEQIGPLTHDIRVISGMALSGLSPRSGVVGTSVALTVEGTGLYAVDAVELVPADGVAVSAPSVAADGRSVSVSLDILEDAPTTAREVRVYAAGQRIPSAGADADRFAVTLPAPQIAFTSPLSLVAGSPPLQLRIGGEYLNDATVRLLPPDGVALGSVAVSDDGRVLHVQAAVAEDAPLGPRLVEIATAGGSTGTTPSPHNTVYVVAEEGATYPAIMAAALEVLRDSEQPPTSLPIALNGPIVGVTKQHVVEPETRAIALPAPAVGVALGPVATRVNPVAGLPGEQLDLVIEGRGLGSVASVSFAPGTGLGLAGAPVTAADGTSLAFAVQIDPAAPPLPHRVVLQRAGGDAITFAPDSATQFRVGHGSPTIRSIEPILAGQGDMFELLVRGEMLFDAEGVSFEPPEGIVVSGTRSVNETGTELRVMIHVEPDASLGARVVRVHVPGAVSTNEAAPANTFNVYESVPN